MICLIRPPAVESFRISSAHITLPLGLAYIAAALDEADYPLCIIDAVAEAPEKKTRYHAGYLIGLRAEDIVERIPRDVQVVGITVIFTYEWPFMVHLVDLIKRARPEIAIILGGEHITSMPEFCLAVSKADYLVLGEGEETVVELLAALNSGAPLASISGIAYREGNGKIIKVTPRRARQRDVDKIAPPAWHHFDVRTYNDHGFVEGMRVKQTTMTLLATRGCPYQCTFCSAPNMWTPRWIARDAKKVVDEIEGYMKRYGARNFVFQDLTAIVKKEWILQFCKEIIERNLDITWQLPGGTRSEAIDYEVAMLLKRTGMLTMSYAPESGSERTRSLIKKKMTTAGLLQSIGDAMKAHLNVTLFFVVGFPHDTEEDLSENLPFLRRVARMGVPDIGINYYMALPGTPLFNSLYDARKITIDQDYFAHILQGAALLPTISYNDSLSRWKLTKWKFRLYFSFYGASGNRGYLGAIVNKVWEGIRGVIMGNHETRLATAFSNGLSTLWDTIYVRLRRRWLSRREERDLFKSWDGTYREIRRQLMEQRATTESPADTTVLHRSNVIPQLRLTHGTEHTIEISATAEIGV